MQEREKGELVDQFKYVYVFFIPLFHFSRIFKRNSLLF